MLFSKQRKCERVGVHVYRGGHFNCLLSLLHREFGDIGFLYLLPLSSLFPPISKGTIHTPIPSTWKCFVCFCFYFFLKYFPFLCVCVLVTKTFFSYGFVGVEGHKDLKEKETVWHSMVTNFKRFLRKAWVIFYLWNNPTLTTSFFQTPFKPAVRCHCTSSIY